MKKLILVLLVGVTVLGSLSGCRVRSSDDEAELDPYKLDEKAVTIEKSFTVPKRRFSDVECTIFKTENRRYLHCNGEESTTLLEIPSEKVN